MGAVRRLALWGSAWAHLWAGLVGVLSLGFWTPKWVLAYAMAGARRGWFAKDAERSLEALRASQSLSEPKQALHPSEPNETAQRARESCSRGLQTRELQVQTAQQSDTSRREAS